MTIRPVMAVVFVALFAAPAALASQPQNSPSSDFIQAQYLTTVPSGNALPARTCKRVCVNAGRGTDKIPAQCLQWQTVCK
jgi:hypothetical protein